VEADKYAGVWVTEAFSKAGLHCEQSAAPKSELYGALLPLVNAHRVELLDLPRLHAQLLGLERRTSRSGRDSIDHGPGGHDDLANAVAGAASAAKDAVEPVGPIAVSPDILGYFPTGEPVLPVRRWPHYLRPPE
jgi:hypothetical protein